MENKFKVAVYLRTSTNSELELTKQETIIKDYCANNNLKIVATYKDIETKANTKFKPNLEALFDETINNEIEFIVVQNISKISKDAFQLYDYFKYLDENCNCSFISVEENIQDIEFVINVKNKKTNSILF